MKKTKNSKRSTRSKKGVKPEYPGDRIEPKSEDIVCDPDQELWNYGDAI